jgi:hypothetical protein
MMYQQYFGKGISLDMAISKAALADIQITVDLYYLIGRMGIKLSEEQKEEFQKHFEPVLETIEGDIQDAVRQAVKETIGR